MKQTFGDLAVLIGSSAQFSRFVVFIIGYYVVVTECIVQLSGGNMNPKRGGERRRN